MSTPSVKPVRLQRSRQRGAKLVSPNGLPKERPIIMQAHNVCAILEGRKTQTRRIIKPKQIAYIDEHQGFREPDNADVCPYGKPGDRLWVKETWMAVDTSFRSPSGLHAAKDKRGVTRQLVYRATTDYHCDWQNCLFMPRWASRLTLEIVIVRAERLHDISEVDARAEGVHRLRAEFAESTYRHAFNAMWSEINGIDSWLGNPWVWVIDFKRLKIANGEESK